MMQFGSGPPHDNVARAIKSELEKHEIIGLRADDRQYHEDLFPNIQTYMHGCGLGVAVFEQVEQKVFNPNVALEVGYMLALNKRICLLKEKNLPALNTDIASKLYRQFDAYDPEMTIPPELSRWLSDTQ
jgi:nucleoside 2-deoxyribosyltransferase